MKKSIKLAKILSFVFVILIATLIFIFEQCNVDYDIIQYFLCLGYFVLGIFVFASFIEEGE